MPTSRETNGLKALVLALLVPALIAAVAVGMLRGNVNENTRNIERIDATMVRIEFKLDRILERLP